MGAGMIGREQKATIARQAERDRKRAARQLVKRLGQELVHARARARDEVREVQVKAKVWLREAMQRARDRYQDAIRDSRMQRDADRYAAKRTRDAAIDEVRAAGLAAVDRAARERAIARSHLREMRLADRHHRERVRDAKKGNPIERVQQSDDVVRQDIDPELVPLWEQVKGRVRGTSRRSRTEAFLAYVHEHPGEQLAAIDRKTDALIRELERDHREARSIARGRRVRKTKAAPPVRDAASDVPF